MKYICIILACLLILSGQVQDVYIAQGNGYSAVKRIETDHLSYVNAIYENEVKYFNIISIVDYSSTYMVTLEEEGYGIPFRIVYADYGNTIVLYTHVYYKL